MSGASSRRKASLNSVQQEEWVIVWDMNIEEQDKRLMERCIELSETALAEGDAPFGSLVARNGEIIAEAANNARNKVTDHAEIMALNRAHEKLGTSDLTGCTLYTNCEPCPMCSFMIREFKISRVVFALPSPYVGGYSKWPVLQDKEMEQFAPFFAEPPEIRASVLEPQAKAVFDRTPMWMFGSDARSDQRARNEKGL